MTGAEFNRVFALAKMALTALQLNEEPEKYYDYCLNKSS